MFPNAQCAIKQWRLFDTARWYIARFEYPSRLDAKSSRGMIYENEELRIRTININAEVERGECEENRNWGSWQIDEKFSPLPANKQFRRPVWDKNVEARTRATATWDMVRRDWWVCVACSLLCCTLKDTSRRVWQIGKSAENKGHQPRRVPESKAE